MQKGNTLSDSDTKKADEQLIAVLRLQIKLANGAIKGLARTLDDVAEFIDALTTVLGSYVITVDGLVEELEEFPEETLPPLLTKYQTLQLLLDAKQCVAELKELSGIAKS